MATKAFDLSKFRKTLTKSIKIRFPIKKRKKF